MFEDHSLESRYFAKTDEELKQLADGAASLTPEAQQALHDEITRRGLDIPMVFSGEEVDFRQLATLRIFRDLPEAMLAKGILEASGIECFTDNLNIVRMDWFLSNAVGGIKLQVTPENLEAANEILQQPIPENFEVEGIGDYQQPHCPKCNSLDIVFEELNEGIAYTSAWLSLPVPVHSRGWTCKSCGHRWGNATTGEAENPRSRKIHNPRQSFEYSNLLSLLRPQLHSPTHVHALEWHSSS